MVQWVQTGHFIKLDLDPLYKTGPFESVCGLDPFYKAGPIESFYKKGSFSDGSKRVVVPPPC